MAEITKEGERVMAAALDKAVRDTVCAVCLRFAERGHPCRFEVACSCWHGVPCDGSGRIGRKR